MAKPLHGGTKWSRFIVRRREMKHAFGACSIAIGHGPLSNYLNWKEDGIVNPDRHPLLSNWPESTDDCRRFYLEYLQELSDGDLKMFDSDATSIGDENFKSKLANVVGRKQIRRGRPHIDQ
jgi:hypothetical protein